MVLAVSKFVAGVYGHSGALIADEIESDAARWDAWHHRADAITSVAALVGVSVAIWGPELT